MPDESELAVDIANRINDVMRHLPDHVQPGDVLTALAAVSARLLTTLRPQDRGRRLSISHDHRARAFGTGAAAITIGLALYSDATLPETTCDVSIDNTRKKVCDG